jgi:iron(III) transport system ATP-binding protein
MPDGGTVEVGGRMVVGPGIFVPPEKRRVGIVFQDYALFPHLDVAANIAYGLPKGANRKERVQEMLSLVGLEGFQSRMPHELSGGEQQRVALARALAAGPEVLLLDEPFSSLDADLRARIRSEVKGILASAGATVIFVTHDQEEALFMGNRVGVMNAGQLEQIDTPEAIFHRPATPFVAQFVGIADFLVGEVQEGAVATEVWSLPFSGELPHGVTVKVMVRPDFIDIRPAVDGQGIIVDRTFQGIYYLYRVRLPSGATIRSLQHHNRFYAINTRVTIEINPDHTVVYFVE